ncbi:LytR family transcriptional regulator [Bacillus sp. FJAT-42376]|uniref:polyisoprenyl-teichoic acid--peptidoglycan teichoic acid transferase TagU n=1 Tax=Bacillus sp. FJAT-42376 TaxID=2014076 RepID=UPI0024059507|nr:LytR family transcriptional regulator [Bacillus sp. FJAT-42376]
MRAKKQKKTWLWVTLSIIGVLVLGVGLYAGYLFKRTNDTVANIQEEVKVTKTKPIVNLEKKEPISILLMGVDERKGDSGRSDSLIYMTVNPNKKEMHMVSIPRDTRTEIVGHNTTDKINHAYAFGGTKMAIETVQKFLGVDVDYFIKVNMESFKQVVDTVGGVQINNHLAFTYEGETFEKGPITLNGEQALKYSRMRYEDPDGDFGRQLRQRKIIEAVIAKGANIQSITKFSDMLSVVENNVKTNMSFDNMWDMVSNYRDASQKMVQHSIDGKGTKIDGIYYLEVPEENRTALTNELKASLDIPPNTASTQ